MGHRKLRWNEWRSSKEETLLEKLWMGLEVTSVWENTSHISWVPAPLVACRYRRDSQGDWEGMEMWWCRETRAHVHISVKMLNLSFVTDTYFGYQLLIRMDEIMWWISSVQTSGGKYFTKSTISLSGLCHCASTEGKIFPTVLWGVQTRASQGPPSLQNRVSWKRTELYFSIPPPPMAKGNSSSRRAGCALTSWELSQDGDLFCWDALGEEIFH